MNRLQLRVAAVLGDPFFARGGGIYLEKSRPVAAGGGAVMEESKIDGSGSGSGIAWCSGVVVVEVVWYSIGMV